MGNSAETRPEIALVPVLESLEAAPIWIPDTAVAGLPVEVDVRLPVRDFRVRHLLALEVGEIIASQWGQGEDLPLACGAVHLAWSEFEVVDTQLAVRITRLA